MMLSKSGDYKSDVTSLFNAWMERKEWKESIANKKTPFISDGVLNPKSWFSQEVRPLFFLKEAYGGNCDWSLQEHLMNTEAKTLRKTWKRISLWSKGILGTDASNIEDYSTDNIETTNNEYLKRIAAINIKKYDGNEFSIYQDLMNHANYYKDLLKEQIELCDPTVIICGYTFDFLKIILEDDDLNNKANKDMFYFTKINGHDVILIDYWHPANHYPEYMNYSTLMLIYQKALQQMQLREN